MQRIDVPNGKATLAVWHEGKGLPLLFLHPGVADSRVWEAQLAHFGGQYRVIAFDGRGFGETTSTPEPFSQVDDVLAVMDALQVAQAVLMGNSLGGRTALDFALAHPERVRALGLIGPAVSGSPRVEQWPEDVQRISDLMDSAEEQGDLDTLNEFEAWLWLDGPAQQGRVLGNIRALFLEMNGKALRAASPGEEILPEHPAWPHLHELQVPGLIIVGDLDLPHIQRNSEHLVRTIPHAELRRLKEAGHLPQLEQPEAFNAVVDGFLRGLT